MNPKYAITGLGLLSISLFSIYLSPSFAQTVDMPSANPPHASCCFLGNATDNPATYTLTVNTIATSYNQNDTIDVSGKISPIKPGLSSVNILVYYEEGYNPGVVPAPIIANYTTSIDDAGNFEQRIRVAGYAWSKSGSYAIGVEYFPGVDVGKSFQIQNPIPVAPN
jgi:hypothetical protein